MWTGLTTWWTELAPDRRKMVIGAGSVAAISIVLSAGMAQRTEWATLADGQPYDVILDHAAALQEAAVPYRIEAPGTLRVAAADLGRARSAISGADNLPSASDASDLPLGVTPEAQRWALLRAREGELARVIGTIDGVSAARVQLVQKPVVLFTEDDEPARASVFIRLRPGAHIGAEAVRSIANLVSGAVHGLPPDRVAIVDHHGNLLAAGTGTGDEATTLLARQTALERRTEERVARALSEVLGYDGGFTVTAAVDLDPTARETTSRRVDPDASALSSEQTEESRTTGTSQPGGVPGVAANVTERPDGGATTPGTERSSTTATYTNSVIEGVERQDAGALRRISVAVQVNETRMAGLAKSAGMDVEELRKRIDASVRAAMGFDAARGDSVGVTFVPFVDVAPMQAPNPVVNAMSTPAGAAVGLLALSILLSFGLVVRPLMKAAGTVAPRPTTASDATTATPAAAEAARDPDGDLASRLKELVDNLERVDARDLSRLVHREGPAAAQVLRRWSRNS